MDLTLRTKFVASGCTAMLVTIAAGVMGHDQMMRHDLASFTQVLLGLGILLTAGCWPLWLALDRWVLHPLEGLAESDRKIRAGVLEEAFVPAAKLPGDEMGAVHQGRNSMLGELIEQRRRLEQEKHHAETLNRVQAAFIAGHLAGGFELALEHLGSTLGCEAGRVIVRDETDAAWRLLASWTQRYARPESLRRLHDLAAGSDPSPDGESGDQVTLHEGDAELPPVTRYAIVRVPLAAFPRPARMELFSKPGLQLDNRAITILESSGRIIGSAAGRLALQEEVQASHERLARQEHLLRQVFEQMPEGICLLDAGCRPAMTSPFARALLDEAGTFEEGRLVALGGRPVNELLGPRGDGMPHDLTLAGEPPRCIEVRSCRLEKGPLEGGQIVQLRDATRERATQCQQERQAHLAAIGQLAAGIAHDFNNLLTSILGSAELLQTEPDPAHCQADLERILHSGRRAAQLVRQILDFSRKSMPARQPIDLVPLVKEMLDLLTRTLPETIRVEQALELEQCTVVADAGQLGQVLTNLAVNARDAMPDGGTLSVTVDARTIEPSAGPSPSRVAAGNWVVLSVTDTGTGIPRKVLEHIFEPFFTTKSAGRGTGLGLAQVYGIVQQHGGSIQVNTRVGLGTTFSVWLPRATSACSGDRPVGSDRPRGSGERVLLVEDDPQVRGMLCKLLTRLGYRVDSAPSGLEALARFESDTSTPDLVLSDVVMPGLTGVELLRRLRASGQTVPVVLMSGYPMGEVIPESAAAAWLEKPASPETLATVLRQALGPVRSRMGCRAAGESPTESSKPPTIPASHEEQARATRGQ